MDEDVGFPTMLLRLVCMAALIALFVLATALLNEHAPAGPIVPLIGLAAFGYTYANSHWRFLGLSSRGWRRYFGFLTGFTAIGAAMGISALSDRREAASAQRIVALYTTDPAREAELLAVADDRMLSRIEAIAPDIAAQEVRRRATAAAEARQKIEEANKRTELANKNQINAILAGVAHLSDDDIDKQIEAYAKLVALAPGRDDYRKTLESWNTERAYRAEVERNPAKGMKLVDFKLRNDADTGQPLVDIKLKNVSNVVLEDFEFRCLQFAQSGSELESPSDFNRLRYYSRSFGKVYPHYRSSIRDYTIIHQRFNPGEAREINNIAMKQLNPEVAGIRCETGLASLDK